MAGINSWLKPVTGKLKELASDIVTVRTGTVISDFAAMTSTIVVLDNDPDGAQVQALALSGPLPTQTRVMMLAYPARGLVIVGSMAAVPPMISGAAPFTYYGGTDSFTATQAAPFRSLLFRVGAGGGAGGGAPATTASNSSGGGGGGGGGYAERLIDVSACVFPLAITVGAGGTAASGGTGGNGAPSTIIDNNGAGTTLLAATAGTGGGTLANGNALGTPSGAGVGGSFSTGAQTGGVGQAGFRSLRFTIIGVHLGMGGYSPAGGGGGAEVGASAAGVDGSFPGGGGSGAHQQGGGGALSGGNGSGGLISIIGFP